MNSVQAAFLKNVVPAAQAAQHCYSIPVSITIAQAILESGWGATALARTANNYFGIKATHFQAPNEYIEFATTEFVDGRRTQLMAAFARYSSPSDCFKAHSLLLTLASRYKPAMAVCADPAKFADELQACGYSTNPDYAAELMRLVDEFDLTQYDLPPTPGAPAAAQAKEKAA